MRYNVIIAIMLGVQAVGLLPGAQLQQKELLGRFFAKKAYTPAPLPKYAEVKSELPSPIYDDNPLWVKTYWKAWELGFRHFQEPVPESGFVSQFIDAAFNQNIFLWDSCFMTMFCNYAYPLVPGISTLDNFYAKQHEDGEISREIDRATGVDFDAWINHENAPLFSRWGWPGLHEGLISNRRTAVTYQGRTPPSMNPKMTLDALDHPILAWAELEHYRITGDSGRLPEVWEPLTHYYDSLQTYLKQGNGLYVTDWASMDNSPRNAYLKGGGTGIDISAEMALFARQLADIAQILGKSDEARQFSAQADEIAKLINDRMWDEQRKFYFDLTLDGKLAPVMTIAAYWTLLANVASPAQAAALVAELKNPDTFGRTNPVPTLAANQEGYEPGGGYWRGSVWAPTETMVLRGLENYGFNDLARDIALKHLDMVARVFEKTGTIWENYAPDALQPGKPAAADFVGWSGIAPIMYLLEYAIGLKADSLHNRLDWQLQPGGRRGCERFRFNGHVVSLVAEPQPGAVKREKISVQSDGPFELRVRFAGVEKQFSITGGRQEFEVYANK